MFSLLWIATGDHSRRRKAQTRPDTDVMTAATASRSSGVMCIRRSFLEHHAGPTDLAAPKAPSFSQSLVALWIGPPKLRISDVRTSRVAGLGGLSLE